MVLDYLRLICSLVFFVNDKLYWCCLEHTILLNTEFLDFLRCNRQEMFESCKRDITVAMMRNYPQLLRKFMSDKAKIPYLLEIIVHMNLEIYSLKRQDQVCLRNFLRS